MNSATYKLVISDDQGHTTVVPLLRDEVTIGREPGNAIRLTERNVSRAHARVVRRNGAFLIEDLGSYNGITVNGQRIDGAAELHPGDQLAIGDYALAFQSDSAPRSTAPPRPAKSQPPPRLVLLGEPASGAEFTLGKPALRIGRDEKLDVWIDHKSISHEHAEIQVDDDHVTLYDLDSANGVRVNGVRTSRAVLEAGDVVQLGEVRFRFLPAEGAHSLIPVSEDLGEVPATPKSVTRPMVALAILAILVSAGLGAVFVTLRAEPFTELPSAPEERTLLRTESERIPPTEADITRAAPPRDDAPSIEEPQEWERELARARRALARGRHDRAYAIADELPEDSVLRETPEFREIRYRYVQSHIHDGERALEESDPERALAEGSLVLEVPGATPKQRQDARRLVRKAKGMQRLRIVD